MIAMKKQTKRERRQEELTRHYSTLERLARHCGVKKPDGAKLSLKLWKLEMEATRITTDYCNGEGMDGNEVDFALNAITEKVIALFAGALPGFHINRDPRGYALKIKSGDVETLYKDIGLHRDWGGYGILSPEIE